MKITILSGRSGSGKTTALQALEDHGYYCVDNLPLGLLPTLVTQLEAEEHPLNRVAVGIDARNLPRQLLAFTTTLDELRASQVDTEIIFLEAEPASLLKRFSATRRRHPLSGDNRTLADAIEYEAQLLADIRMRADLVIDTSSLDVHSLRNMIRQRVARRDVSLSLLIQSFGYKNGLPYDSDLVFDVRALPNPHWHNDLRPFTGRDEKVAEFLRGHPESGALLDDIFNYLTRWLPVYAANDRSYVTVAIGCTGGRHRSVYITEQLAQRLRDDGIPLHVRHRELDG
ncbi:RNase adapter RapZ [Alloalcanivorax mobilis]|uniref:RNase adapter RapZ n=1 Tax=Alloalcanivorax mobilis TaxID=2019569 RepID=UPI000C78A5B6|nr:RNase adapter RapZ [Alloalcanivorax mobilis]|tara:strand:+ start:29123 stop:29977 length:855 start_codon:yes stop_codon:yes gene_type:complete